MRMFFARSPKCGKLLEYLKLMTEHYDATDLLVAVTQRHGISLSVLIAETGLWASPAVHRYLKDENQTGAYYPHTRRYRRGEQRGDEVCGIYLDDNSFANTAIKQSLGIDRSAVVGFEACHIWPDSCYDARYHTVIANLVLLPAALAGLSDHHEETRAILQYRSRELYGWWPEGDDEPSRPATYPTIWREPFPFTDAIAKTLRRRRPRMPQAVALASTTCPPNDEEV